MDPVLVLSSTVSTATTMAAAAADSVAATGSGGLEALVTSAVASIAASALASGLTTTAPVSATVVALPAYIELSAAFTGGLYGGLAAVAEGFDIMGVVTIAVVAGLGGGIIRDVLLQKHGIFALDNPSVLLAVLVAALVAFFFASAAKRAHSPLFVIDAIALGLFAVAGTDKALLAGLTVVPAILLGTITSVGGGVLRDVLMNEVPEALRPGALYAVAAVVGSTTYVTLVLGLGLVKPIAMGIVVLIVVLLRVLAVRLGWQSPMPTDLSLAVTRLPQHAARLLSRRRRVGRDR